MATITPAAGKGSLVSVNGIVLRLATWRRTRAAGELEFATTGMAPDADGNYETPHTAGLIKSGVTLEGPYDLGAPFHNAPYNIRSGTVQLFRFAQSAAGPLTPASYWVVIETTDENAAAELGKWSATIRPYTDTSAGYFTAAG